VHFLSFPCSFYLLVSFSHIGILQNFERNLAVFIKLPEYCFTLLHFYRGGFRRTSEVG